MICQFDCSVNIMTFLDKQPRFGRPLSIFRAVMFCTQFQYAPVPFKSNYYVNRQVACQEYLIVMHS